MCVYVRDPLAHAVPFPCSSAYEPPPRSTVCLQKTWMAVAIDREKSLWARLAQDCLRSRNHRGQVLQRGRLWKKRATTQWGD